MLEAAIEKAFKKKCNKLGFLCVKQQINGFPDRLVVSKEGKHVWVELKTEKGRLTPNQIHAIEALRKNKAEVHVVYGLTAAIVVLDNL